MTNVTLVVIPGPGARTVTLSEGATVSDLVRQENLAGRDIIINGVGVQSSDWNTYVVASNSEIFATASVKGNAK